ncbi:hypothetical protein O181_062183 [Austropuccinia psidii MF-1]|uniref:Uncharacterized protein n=1 Tax=Austropuccinia psidii MF-1 TaxID=1389203 RepID=A0A9Q3EJA7_9BASI|nr:hypothetical protein [Austropuccinia psidii MF-1]
MPEWHPMVRGLILQQAIKPSKHNEPPFPTPTPPIPGVSLISDSQVPSHENDSTCEPEPEVASACAMEGPCGKQNSFIFFCYQHSLTPPLAIFSSSPTSLCFIFIDNKPVRTPPSPEVPPVSAKNPIVSFHRHKAPTSYNHRGKSCVKCWRLTSCQANIEHTSSSGLTQNPVTSTNIGSPVPSTEIPHHQILPQPSKSW